MSQTSHSALISAVVAILSQRSLTKKQMADGLNNMGYRTPTGMPFTKERLNAFINANRIGK